MKLISWSWGRSFPNLKEKILANKNTYLDENLSVVYIRATNYLFVYIHKYLHIISIFRLLKCLSIQLALLQKTSTARLVCIARKWFSTRKKSAFIWSHSYLLRNFYSGLILSCEVCRKTNIGNVNAREDCVWTRRRQIHYFGVACGRVNLPFLN